MVRKLLRVPLVRSFGVLIADRSIQLLSQLFNVFVVSYFLGPGNFGVLMYALALYGLLLSVSNFGLERILVVELAHANTDGEKRDILLTGLAIKIITSIILLLIAHLGYPFFSSYISAEVYSTFLLLSVNIFFCTWVVIDAFNQYAHEFRNTAFARIIAAILGIVVRLVIVFMELDFKWMVISFIVEQIICLILCIVFSKKFISFIKRFATVNFAFQPSLLKSGFYVVLSVTCIIIYFRASQSIVEQKFSKSYLGVYSLVLILLEMPVSIASILSTLITPRLTKLKQLTNTRNLNIDSYILFIFLLVGITSALGIMLVGYILSFVLNDSFEGFFGLLLKGLIVVPVIFVGYCFNLFLLTERKFNIYLAITVCGAISAVVFLYFSVPNISMSNATYYFVLTQVIASVLIPVIMQKGLFNKLANSILLTIRPGLWYNMRTLFAQLSK